MDRSRTKLPSCPRNTYSEDLSSTCRAIDTQRTYLGLGDACSESLPSQRHSLLVQLLPYKDRKSHDTVVMAADCLRVGVLCLLNDHVITESSRRQIPVYAGNGSVRTLDIVKPGVRDLGRAGVVWRFTGSGNLT